MSDRAFMAWGWTLIVAACVMLVAVFFGIKQENDRLAKEYASVCAEKGGTAVWNGKELVCL